MTQYVLAIDQGTTSSRAILLNHDARIAGVGQEPFEQILPSPGVVEHDPEVIWSSQLNSIRGALKGANAGPDKIAAIGVTNQRETTILWDRQTGKPVANAIVWQSRITAPICEKLIRDGHETTFRNKTGLVVDAYFSGTKIKHLLDSIPGLRARAEKGEVLFGTVDSYLIWRLSGGKLHITDPSNASRTLCFNIQTMDWDDELLRILNIPRKMLPEVRSSSEIYGQTDAQLLGKSVPIAGIAGDQQAAMFGQACYQPGMAKNTYGTGCFMLLNTGDKPVASKNRLLTTVGWKVGGKTVYCLEGAVFIAGAVVQWLRDGLKIIAHSEDVEKLASTVPDTDGVYFVPAFVGLGAPYWDPYARGTILGLSRGTSAAHIARAALDSMAYQTRDVLEAMQADSGIRLKQLRVDGGASVNNGLMQFQADILGVPVQRPRISETTALGAAYLAGLATGFWSGTDELSQHWAIDREYGPVMPADKRDHLYSRWRKAVERAQHWEERS